MLLLRCATVFGALVIPDSIDIDADPQDDGDRRRRRQKIQRGREIFDLPRDSGGRLEMWRTALSRGQSGLELIETLDQELKVITVGAEVDGGDRREQMLNCEQEILRQILELLYPRASLDDFTGGCMGVNVVRHMLQELATGASQSLLKNDRLMQDIVLSAFKTTGFSGITRCVLAQRSGAELSELDFLSVQEVFGRINHEERRFHAAFHSELVAARGQDGALAVSIERKADRNFRVSSAPARRPNHHRSAARFGARNRRSRGKAARRPGSRRAVSRSSGGGDDDGAGGSGGSDPPGSQSVPLAARHRHRRRLPGGGRSGRCQRPSLQIADALSDRLFRRPAGPQPAGRAALVAHEKGGCPAEGVLSVNWAMCARRTLAGGGAR
jgi:hypothetical protein